MDAAGITAFLRRLREQGLELHSFMVARRGAVLAEGWWAPYTASDVHQFYSVTKTFAATCLGSLVDEGLVELDRPVVEYFDWLGEVDERLQRLTLRHCLNMATGHHPDPWHEPFRELPATDGHDPIVREAFTLVPESEPGSVFCYNQIATYLLGAVVREVTGAPMLDELRRRILEPLGIDQFHMKGSVNGKELGFTGGYGVTEALLRLGLMYLGRGTLDGRRVLSEEWIEQATTFLNPDPQASPDSSYGYGFQLWRSKHGYRGDGAFGQLMLVLPEQEMVVVTTAHLDDVNSQPLLDAVWDTIIPAVDRVAETAADDELAAELAGLQIPPFSSTGEPGTRDYWRREGDGVPGGWDGLCLRPSEDGATLHFESHDITIAVGDGLWSRSHWVSDGFRTDVAASGGWRDGEFEAEIRMLHIPHIMRLSTSGETFRFTWLVDPLNSQDPFFYNVIPA